ncbi:MAG: NTP transferase domain-containing protein [Ignavibacteria bacterium]|nr:NTP transferase domain-containing protein [Ignavibacteria bacterium]MBI3766105.1 NTP transferase domain-containing protein [Ignavibacteriales bacterium]
MISGIILAGGYATPSQVPIALLEFGKKTFIQHIVDAFYSAQVSDVVVVLGSAEEGTIQMSSWFEGKIVSHDHSNGGVMKSVCIGYDMLDQKELHGAMICPVQYPLMTQSLLVNVLQAYWKSNKKIVAPTYRGERGYPVIMNQSIIEETKSLPGKHDIESVLHQYDDRLLEFPTDEAGAILSVNSQSDFKEKIIQRRV